MNYREIQQLPEIEIHRCFTFYCEECGRESLIRVITTVSGAWIPMAVECYDCGAKFRTPSSFTEDGFDGYNGVNAGRNPDDDEGGDEMFD